MSIPKIFKNVTFRQLEIFARLVKTGNFTSTARDLYLTQPTISFQMKKLEQTLGTPLFEHVNRQFHLTEAGEKLSEVSQEIFDSLNRFETDLSSDTGMMRSDLYFSGVTTTEYLIPQIFKEFKQLYPEICFLLNICDRENLIRRLHDNRDDLYLIDQDPDSLDVVSIPFMENPLIVIAGLNHRLAGKSSIPIEEIVKENMLLRESGSGTRNALKHFFHNMGVNVSIDMEFSSNEAIKRSVINELGISILSKYAVIREYKNNELTYLDVEGFPLMEKWYIVYPKNKHITAAAKAFLEFLLEKGSGILEATLEKEKMLEV